MASTLTLLFVKENTLLENNLCNHLQMFCVLNPQKHLGNRFE